jgi:uncharacterized protein YgbK (DUF1537 family)
VKPLRLIADDLTGALDSAAQFAGPGREIPVFFGDRIPAGLPAEFAVDSGSREGDGAAAAATASRLAQILSPAPGVVSFRKLDSLLRGHPALEIAATLGSVQAARFMVAPAFPLHGRVTRGGLQHVQRGGSWERTGEDLRAALESLGIAVALACPGDPVPRGVSLWDAETDADLRRIARSGAGLAEPPLWCGSGGLAAALSAPGGRALPIAGIGRPLLGIVGSDHPVAAAQLGACGAAVLVLRDGGDAEALGVSAALGTKGVCLVRFELPDGIDRSGARARIARGIDELARRILPPASVLAVGGETLRSLCACVGADWLVAVGQVLPGVPVSRIVGGRWDGTVVISKSGAFGDEALLMRLISPGE